jgi:hypothetical protein
MPYSEQISHKSPADTNPARFRLEPLTKINELLFSETEKQRYMEQLQQVVERPMHYLFDLREEEKAIDYIKSTKENYLSTPVGIEKGMSASEVLASILGHKSLGIDWKRREYKNFSTEIVSIGKEKDCNIEIVLWDMHHLNDNQQTILLNKIKSTDMKSFGGVREIRGARKIQFIANGDTRRLQDPYAWKQFFNDPGESHPSFDESVASRTYDDMQQAFLELKTSNESWIRSPRKSGKSAAAAVLRRKFPEGVYILKVDKLIDDPREIMTAWVPEPRIEQVTIVDRAEVLQEDRDAIQFLVNRFGKVLFLKSVQET